MTPILSIRPFQPADWESICEIHDQARLDELKGSCDPRGFIPIREDPEVEHLKSCQKIVAVDGNRVAGFIGVDQEYVGWLYIHPDYYRQGLGRRLLRAGLELTPDKAWTIALENNLPALTLYHSEGFHETNRYESDNAGYPVTCVRLERSKGKGLSRD